MRERVQGYRVLSIIADASPMTHRTDQNNADANVKRNATRSVARDRPRGGGRVTNGRLDSGTWERICSGQAEWLARES